MILWIGTIIPMTKYTRVRFLALKLSREIAKETILAKTSVTRSELIERKRLFINCLPIPPITKAR
jgi:hypothetical protein